MPETTATPPRAAFGVGLMSGGLDSTLAAAILKEAGARVVGLNFSTGFCMTDHRRAIGRQGEDPRRLRNEALRAASDIDVEIRVIDVAEEYFEMVKAPKHGYGSKANPCIDCRIFMLERARQVMLDEGADFVFTGEVLGQRPFSQHMASLRLIEKETGLAGRLLRPLSAQYMPPTIPEKEGLIDRGRLLSIRGRSRRPQAELARRLGVVDYPQPSGGCCYLADENFARKFMDKLSHPAAEGKITRDEIILLKVGRHFRLGPATKVIVGRDEGENAFLERFAEGRWELRAAEHVGPVTIVEGDAGEEVLIEAARIAARYGDGRAESSVRIALKRGEERRLLDVPPALDAEIDSRRL
ncbi:MAG: thiamine biosynthesis protein [Acidobacteria bacterium]|nr:thiamine biosynthesis protein [Acidobacteriota bacterium]